MYYLKRIIALIPVLLIISFVCFFIMRISPGGPFDRERKLPDEVVRNIEKKYHLNEPIFKQYLRYLGGLLQGDFGPSLKYRNHSVTEIIGAGLPVSVTLGLSSFLFAMGIGIPLGVYSAAKKGQALDLLTGFGAILSLSVPALILGPLLIMYFAVKNRWFPVALWGSPLHIILPTIALGTYFGGKLIRLTRDGILQTLNSDFVRTARSKGVSSHAILWKHVLPVSIIPVISYSGPLLADLLTGSFVVENVFQIPGIGMFMVNSSLNLDYPLVTGLVLLYGVILLVLNLAVDFLMAWLDPRIRYE
jgi:oligopeptide transport system permease protein